MRLKAAGVQFHKYSDEIMKGSYKAATELYEEEAAKNAEVQEDLRRVEDVPRRGGGLVRAQRVWRWTQFLRAKL